MSEGKPTSAAGWPIFVFGLLLYIVGRSQDILLFEIGSVISCSPAILLLTRGGTPRAGLVPALFLGLHGPAARRGRGCGHHAHEVAVSQVAEQVLYWVGYPIARSGVTLKLANTNCWSRMPVRACTHCYARPWAFFIST